jgi:hypothetical protein
MVIFEIGEHGLARASKISIGAGRVKEGGEIIFAIACGDCCDDLIEIEISETSRRFMSKRRIRFSKEDAVEADGGRWGRR